MYVSFDKGTTWHSFSKNFPNVAVHDLVIQPTARHLIVGTHGRSLYKADIASLQKMDATVFEKSSHIFAINNIRKSGNWGRSWSQWREANTPEIKIPFYSNADKKVTIDVYLDDTKVNSFSVEADRGYNEMLFDVSFSKKGKNAFEKAKKKETETSSVLREAKNGLYYLPKGKYIVKIDDVKSEFEIE